MAKNIMLKTEFIRLEALLKFADVVTTGGEAKIAIKSGKVSVNGEVSLQRGKKVRPGDTVVIAFEDEKPITLSIAAE